MAAACMADELSSPFAVVDDGGQTDAQEGDAQEGGHKNAQGPDAAVDGDGTNDAEASTADAGDELDATLPPADADASASDPTKIRLPASGVCSADGWCWHTPFPTGNALYASARSGPNDVWFVGRNTILHYDGMIWRGATRHNLQLRAVSASTASDAWALGTVKGVASLLHWDGTEWSIGPMPTAFPMKKIWARTPSDVWMVGEAGVIFHFDGVNWSSTPSGTASDLTDIHGSGPTNVWAVGGSAIRRWDGAQWAAPNPPPPPNTTAGVVRVDSSTDVWVFGSKPVHFDGALWGVPSDAGNPGPSDEQTTTPIGIGRTVAGDPLFLGRPYSFRWDGTKFMPYEQYASCFTSVLDDWYTGKNEEECEAVGQLVLHDDSEFPRPGAIYARAAPGGGRRSVYNLNGVGPVWTPGGGEFWAIQPSYGSVGRLLRVNPLGIVTFPDWGGTEPSGLHGSASDNVFVTSKKNGVVSHFDGQAFGAGTVGQPVGMRTPWTQAKNDAWVLSYDSHAWYFNGSTWTDKGVPPGSSNITIWGSGPNAAWAFGKTAARWNGTSWSQVTMNLAIPRDFYSAWGTGPNDVWAVGERGALVHFDGNTLVTRYDPGPASIGPAIFPGTSIAWVGADELYVATEDFHHWQGGQWRKEESCLQRSAVVAASGPNDVWALADGTLLRRR